MDRKKKSFVAWINFEALKGIKMSEIKKTSSASLKRNISYKAENNHSLTLVDFQPNMNIYNRGFLQDNINKPFSLFKKNKIHYHMKKDYLLNTHKTWTCEDDDNDDYKSGKNAIKHKFYEHMTKKDKVQKRDKNVNATFNCSIASKPLNINSLKQFLWIGLKELKIHGKHMIRMKDLILHLSKRSINETRFNSISAHSLLICLLHISNDNAVVIHGSPSLDDIIICSRT